MKVGIKETLEMLDGMGEASVTGKKVVVAVKKALVDGFGPEDLAILGELMAAMPDTSKLDAAVKGAGDIPEELKDLDKDETIQIIAKIYEQSARFNKA